LAIFRERTPNEALIIAPYPTLKTYNKNLIEEFDFVKDLISGIRTIRKDQNISFKESIVLNVMNNENFTQNFDHLVMKMGNISEIIYISNKVENAMSFRVKSNEYFIPIDEKIDIEAEKVKIQEELIYLQGFLKSVQNKLSNERFVSSAPEAVVAAERKKEIDTLNKIEALRKNN